MKKVVIVGCLVLAVLYTAGCGNSVVGTYKGNNGSTLTVGKNGFARWTFPPGLTGAKTPTKSSYIPYKVKGDILSLVSSGTNSQGKTVEKGFDLKIQGNKLILLDENGRVTKSIWTKQ